ncbi:hypothetical protein DFJ58DRAFT_912002 [Suillus subalutaceus]|uniref:uncharacterized protein n=1 Tax=Suillus subalutaceus TaxID=48586 RepID=UPI001B864C9B|nr:uncharacterized protein DFJ58DRAFT_912002 [Suillus subalutaceus]KAG1865560.1 hypothetical protein DFJ58DRAFT_912002 [Suillus subalutaceus]
MNLGEGGQALAENDDGGHTRVWAPKAHLQSPEKDEGSEGDGRMEFAGILDKQKYERIVVGADKRQKVVLFVVKRFLPPMFLLLGPQKSAVTQMSHFKVSSAVKQERKESKMVRGELD